MNFLDIVLILVLAAVIGRALYVFITGRTKGGCGCGCTGCTKDSCAYHPKEKDHSADGKSTF